MQEMRQRLGLSDAQVDQLNALFEVDGPKMKGVREDASLSDTQKREQLKSLSDARREKFNDAAVDLMALKQTGPVGCRR